MDSKITKIFLITFLVSLLGCSDKAGNNYLVIKRNGFEIFHSNLIDKASVIGSRVFIELEYEDRKVLTELAEVFDEPVLVDVYVGELFYTEVLIDFHYDYLRSHRISLPYVEENIQVFKEAGVRIQ